jgi:hypothetical protein
MPARSVSRGSRAVKRTPARQGYAGEVPSSAPPVKSPNVHPSCLNTPRLGDDGFEELCHLVAGGDPDTALCGRDVTGYPWNPPWPMCEACLAVGRGEMN